MHKDRVTALTSININPKLSYVYSGERETIVIIIVFFFLLITNYDFLVVASWDCTIICWNAMDFSRVKSINIDPVGNVIYYNKESRRNNSFFLILGICWSLTLRRDPIGIKTLVAGCRDNDIVIYSVDLKVLSSMEECKWAYKNDQVRICYYKSILMFQCSTKGGFAPY